MARDLSGKRVAILATNGVERVELEQPRGALYGAGADTELLSIHPGEIQARQFDLVSAGGFSVDKLVTDASPDDYDALLLPGGTVNPDQLRINPDAVAFVRAFAETGKPIAAICHGPWTLITAGVVQGRRLTSWPSLRDDLRNAGAEPVDEQVVVDGQFTTSRSPADLPAFCPAIVEQFAAAGCQANRRAGFCRPGDPEFSTSEGDPCESSGEALQPVPAQPHRGKQGQSRPGSFPTTCLSTRHPKLTSTSMPGKKAGRRLSYTQGRRPDLDPFFFFFFFFGFGSPQVRAPRIRGLRTGGVTTVRSDDP